MIENKPFHILVVDDTRSVSALLQHTLLAEGYEVTVAQDGLEAMVCVDRQSPDLILLDLDMPFMDGFEVTHRVKSNPATRLIPIIILTGQTCLEAKLRAWELGADEFLPKPFQTIEVLARCNSLLRYKRLVDELDSAEAVMFALIRAGEAKSPYTQGHSERVAKYATALGELIGLRADRVQLLRKGALLHDIGKISVPDAILNKAERLTEEEYVLVKQHTVQGARIVEPLRSMRDAIPMIRWHHERLDGRGYPDGLRSEEIPAMVRILSVADVYDSLASTRPYREALPHAVCLEIMEKSAADGGLDPEMVDLFAGLPEFVGLPRHADLPLVPNMDLIEVTGSA